MVIAPGSVMTDPSSGPTVRIDTHQAAGVPRPMLASCRSASSANRTTGRVDASAMMTTTNSGSVYLTPSFR